MKKIMVPFLLTASLLALFLNWLSGGQSAAARQGEQYSPVQTFIIQLKQSADEHPEALVDEQIAIGSLLELLVSQGVVQDYHIYYGKNEIIIQALEHVRQMIAELPNVKSVDNSTAENLDLNISTMDAQPADPAEDNGVISGVITRSDTNAPLSGMSVRTWFYDLIGELNIITTQTTANGTYQLTGLRLTTHRLEIFDPLGNYVKEYYDNKSDLVNATYIFLDSQHPNAIINAALDPSYSLSGIVKNLNNSALKDMTATAWKFEAGEWKLRGSDVTDSSGMYTIKGLPSGPFRVGFTDWRFPKVYITEYYPNHDLIELAQDVNVSIEPPTPPVNVNMGGYASITGAVTGAGGTSNMTGIKVDVWGDILGQWTHEISGTATTASNGLYSSNYLGTRNYRLRFSDPFGMYATEYYDNKSTFDAASPIAVNLGYPTSNTNVTLSLNPNTPITQTFGAGWYLVGWPVNLTPSDPETVFGPIENTLDIVWDYDACAHGSEWTFYNPELPVGNTLEALAPPQGYWVKNTGSAALTVQGQHSVNTSINLCTGWNLIGYPAARPRPVKDVLAPISGKYTLVYGYDGNNPSNPWERYNPASQIGNSLTTLQPGRAYWINMTQSSTLNIPAR